MDLLRLHRAHLRPEHLTPVPVPLLSPAADHAFTSRCAHDPGDGEFTGANCLLDRSQTDWNFMPFRLHKNGGCVSYGVVEDSKSKERPPPELRTAPCVTNVTYSFMNSTYSNDQLWHFLPLLTSTQQLRVLPLGQPMKCLTSYPIRGNSSSSSSDDDNEARRLLQMADCVTNHETRDALAQLFLVRVLHGPAATEAQASEPHAEYIVGTKNLVHATLPAQAVVSVAQVTDPADRHLLEDWHPVSHRHRGRHRQPPPAPAAAHPLNPRLRCLTVYPANSTATGAECMVMEACDVNSPLQRIPLERTSTVAWVKYIRRRVEHQYYYPGSNGAPPEIGTS